MGRMSSKPLVATRAVNLPSREHYRKSPLWDALESLPPLTESEKEFLDRLLDYGEIEPVLLTEDTGLAARIRHHPGLEWKAINVREFKGR